MSIWRVEYSIKFHLTYVRIWLYYSRTYFHVISCANVHITCVHIEKCLTVPRSCTGPLWSVAGFTHFHRKRILRDRWRTVLMFIKNLSLLIPITPYRFSSETWLSLDVKHRPNFLLTRSPFDTWHASILTRRELSKISSGTFSYCHVRTLQRSIWQVSKLKGGNLYNVSFFMFPDWYVAPCT